MPEYVPPPGTYLDRGMCQSGSAEREFMPYRLPFVVLNCKYLPNISPRGLVCSDSIVFSACNMFSQCPVTALCSWPESLVPNLLLSDVKLFVTCISHMPCFQEKGILSEKSLYI